MEKEKNVIFEAFARKAAERIEERKKLRTMRLMVKSVGMEVEIRGLTEEEIRDCMDFSDESIEVDKYTIYMASPTLQKERRKCDADQPWREGTAVCAGCDAGADRPHAGNHGDAGRRDRACRTHVWRDGERYIECGICLCPCGRQDRQHVFGSFCGSTASDRIPE